MAAVACVGALAVGGTSAVARAASAQAQPVDDASGSSVSSAPSGTAASTPSKVADPDQVLAKGWRTSIDRAVTVIGDDNGLNVLVADSSAAYQWRTAASLSEPGFDTSQWIGQACVTGSGRYAAVVYAPWSFSDDADEFDHASFAAIVNLETGAVRKLSGLVSLAYYSPGCGTDDSVAFSALYADNGPAQTKVELVDAENGAVEQQSEVPGQVTSTVPYGSGVAASFGTKVIEISAKGAESTLAEVSGVAMRLHPDMQGGLGFEVPVGQQVRVERFAEGRATTLGTAALGQVELQAAAGHVYLTGPQASKIQLGAKPVGGWRSLGGAATGTPSTEGSLLVTSVSNHVNSTATSGESTDEQSEPTLVSVVAAATGTGKQLAFSVQPAALQPAQGSAESPALSAFGSTSSSALTQAKASAKADSADSSVTTINTGYSITNANDDADAADVTWDSDRGCAVARNDPAIQTFQATAQQIEWAADLAVQGELTVSRGVNWEDSGMPVSWTPQGMFPLQTLDGGGTVPVQVLLGILAQETNTLQASPHAVDGETGNLNQGGFYGDPTTTDPAPDTSWSDVDCGYGVGQVTTGMTIGYTDQIADGSTAFTTAEEQQAIATDYASNIAATLNMLIDVWNELYTDGIVANGGASQYIENWWFATWAYNSGIEPTAKLGNTTGCTPGPDCTDGNGDWGLGWANNPANPVYPGDRKAFTNSSTDTSTPQDWSYEEKVMGWAATPLVRYAYGSGSWASAYAAGHWSGSGPDDPPLSQFCYPGSVGDNCTPDGANDDFNGTDDAGLCTLTGSYADHCWWHISSTWTTECSTVCGTAVLTYNASSTRPSFTDIYPPDCSTSGLPSNIVIVGDTTVPSAATCDQTWTYQGSFSVNFPYDPATDCVAPCIDYPGKIDFHQAGVGFGGHIWFTHTQQTATVTGTWTPPSSVSGWTRVLIHVPDSGAVTEQAAYTIGPLADQDGQSEIRWVNQHTNENSWIDLGVFDLAAGATVSLSNQTYDGNGSTDIAFDAVGFAPLAQKPADFVVQLGDSYSSGEGAEPYQPGTDLDWGNSEWDACRRSEDSWIRDAELPGDTQTIGALADSYDSSLDMHSLACSGAYIGDVDSSDPQTQIWGKDGEFDEYPQIQAGFLDSNTTLVALTVGGNDAGFSSVIQSCITSGCPADGTEEAAIDELLTPLTSLLEDVHNAAPNAKIVLLGYPEPFDTSAWSASCSTATLLTSDQMTQLNSWSDDLDSIQDGAALAAVEAGVPASDMVYDDTDVNAAFDGYRLCDGTEGINAIVLGQTGPGDFGCTPSTLLSTWCVSRESFHPNDIGTQRYADAFQDALSESSTDSATDKAKSDFVGPRAGS